MRRRTSKIFAGLDERRILNQVGFMGEMIAESLISGERVSDDENFPFADIVHIPSGTACQVKMCNGRHAARISPNQINRLGEEVECGGFVFGTGIYALVFYRGIDDTKNGKSLIFSRRNSGEKRRQIIAEELQYIYIIDVPLLVHITENHPDFYKIGCIVSSQGKKGREGAIYLNRTTLAGFRDRESQYKEILNTKYGTNGWTTTSTQIEFCFTRNDQVLQRKIPIHYIGSKKTARVVKERMLAEHPNIQLDFNNVLF